jgi:hypothetical protein
MDDPMQGISQARASSKLFGDPSCRLGKTNRSEAAR